MLFPPWTHQNHPLSRVRKVFEGVPVDSLRLLVRRLIRLPLLLYLLPLQVAKALQHRMYIKVHPPKRKALLIGIIDTRMRPILQPEHSASTGHSRNSSAASAPVVPDEYTLKGPHQDVRDVHKLLLDVYKYNPEDITILIDDDDPNKRQPTREHILDAVDELVKDAQPGDRFFFHFSGHCAQKDTDDTAEEDRKNEFLLTCDDNMIQDNELQERLIAPLPVGSSLVAILDACHSATLLDLPHFRCNRVYVPWHNKGKRKTALYQNRNVRRQAKIISPATPTQNSIDAVLSSVPRPTPLRISIDQVLSPANSNFTPAFVQSPVVENSKRGLTVDTCVRFCDDATSFVDESPTSMYCTGWCREPPYSFHTLPDTPNADVMALSSSKDGERSWEGPGGTSMTQALVEFLRENPHPSLRFLLTDISHHLHDFYLDLHARSRDYKVKVKEYNDRRPNKPPRKGKTVEMDNFQHPQFSSSRPLDMDKPWTI